MADFSKRFFVYKTVSTALPQKDSGSFDLSKQARALSKFFANSDWLHYFDEENEEL